MEKIVTTRLADMSGNRTGIAAPETDRLATPTQQCTDDYPTRRYEGLSTDEALYRLGTVPMGRLVSTEQALPAIRPAKHLVDHTGVIIRSPVSATSSDNKIDTVVAYQADSIDPETHLGWSVVVTGFARPISEDEELVRYRQTPKPLLSHQTHQLIRIEPEIVTGHAIFPVEPADHAD